MDSERVDLLSLVRRDVALTRKGMTSGGEYAGACPFCRAGRDRFIVWPAHPTGRGRWWCRRCNASGDEIDYVQRRDGVGFLDARRSLNVSPGPMPRRRPVNATRVVEEPTAAWRARADTFVAECERALGCPDGNRTRDYLHGRGISGPAIRHARLGLNVVAKRESRTLWGLHGDRGVWVPRGIVLPVTGAAGALRGLQIHRAGADPKYVTVAGGTNALYGAPRLSAAKPAILVEGAFDAIAIDQAAGDIVTPVATLSTTGARQPRWFARLSQAPLLLLCFDADEGGRAACEYWSGVFPTAHVWRPTDGDPSDMWARGGDVGLRRWVVQGLGREIDDGIEAHCERIAMRLEGC
jgi:DNA primase